MTPSLEPAPSSYVPRDPSTTVLSHVVADYLETFLASLDADLDAKGLPAYVQFPILIQLPYKLSRKYKFFGSLLCASRLLAYLL
jgi:hypothetical protein